MQTILVISSIFLWLLVLLNLMLTIALVRRSSTSQNTSLPRIGLEPGQVAPDFTAQSLDGETVRLADYAGRKIALLFISAQCDPCHEAAPNFAALLPKATSLSVELAMVSASDEHATQAFVEELNIQLPVLLAPRLTNTFLNDYKANSTPSYCVINDQGIVQATGHPNMDGGVKKVLADMWMEQEKVTTLQERR